MENYLCTLTELEEFTTAVLRFARTRNEDLSALYAEAWVKIKKYDVNDQERVVIDALRASRPTPSTPAEPAPAPV